MRYFYLYIFSIFTTLLSAQNLVCTDSLTSQTLVMYDSWGDGWNGNIITILNSEGDTVIQNSLETGFSDSSSYCLAQGVYQLNIDGGSYPNEISFSFGNLINEPAGDYLVLVGDSILEAQNCNSDGFLAYNQQDALCISPTALGLLSCGNNLSYTNILTQNYGLKPSSYYSFSISEESDIVIDINNFYWMESGISTYIFDGNKELVRTDSHISESEHHPLNTFTARLEAGTYYLVFSYITPSFSANTLDDFYQHSLNESQIDETYSFSLSSYDGTCTYSSCGLNTAFNYNNFSDGNLTNCDSIVDLGSLQCGLRTSYQAYNTTLGGGNSSYLKFEINQPQHVDLSIYGLYWDFKHPFALLFNGNQELVETISYTTESTLKKILELPSAGTYYLIVTASNPHFTGTTLEGYYTHIQTNPQIQGDYKLELFFHNEACDYFGCTDSLAYNFDELANLSDSSCQYPQILEPINCENDYQTIGYINDMSGLANVAYYQITLETASELQLDLLHNSPGIVIYGFDKPYIHLFDSTQTLIDYQTNDYEGNIIDYSKFLEAGTYYIAISDFEAYFSEGTLHEYAQKTKEISGHVMKFILKPRIYTSECEIEACIDSTAINFNPIATESSDQCVYGITDLGIVNCNPLELESEITSSNEVENSSYLSFEILEDADVIIDVTGGTTPYLLSPSVLLFDENKNLIQTSLSSSYSNLQSAHFLEPGTYFAVITGGDPDFEIGSLRDYYEHIKNENQNTGSFTVQLTAYDGSCEHAGCTELNAFNYNPFATVDDGSCHTIQNYDTLLCGITTNLTQPQYGGTGYENSHYSTFNIQNPAEVFFTTESYHELDFILYDEQKNLFNSYEYRGDSLRIEFQPGHYYLVVFSPNSIMPGLATTLEGHYEQMNYYYLSSTALDVAFTLYDGTCTNEACNNPEAINYSMFATTNSNCHIPTVYNEISCGTTLSISDSTTNPTGINNAKYYTLELLEDLNLKFNFEANGSYFYPELFIFSEEGDYINSVHSTQEYSLLGDTIALESGSYQLILSDKCYSCSSNNYTVLYNHLLYDYYQDIGQFTLDIYAINNSCAISGCIDSSAVNYNSQAQLDDSSCYYPELLSGLGCDTSIEHLGQNNSLTGLGNTSYFTFTVPDTSTAFLTIDGEMSELNNYNFTPHLTLFDEQRNLYQTIEANTPKYIYNQEVLLLPGVYFMAITSNSPNSLQSNLTAYYKQQLQETHQVGYFNIELNLYNSSCTPQGCTDTSAPNYNSIALIEDGSCEYPVSLNELNCGQTTTYNYFSSDEEPYAYLSFNLNEESDVFLNLEPDTNTYSIYVFDQSNQLINYLYEYQIPAKKLQLQAGEYHLIICEQSNNNYTEQWFVHQLTNQLRTENQHLNSFTLELNSQNTSCEPMNCVDSLAINYNPFYGQYTCQELIPLGSLNCGEERTVNDTIFETDLIKSKFYQFELSEASQLKFSINYIYGRTLRLYDTSNTFIAKKNLTIVPKNIQSI